MVAIVAGNGLGLENTSARTLGGRGLLGNTTLGRGGEQVCVNAATGNLVIQKTDEILTGLGPDALAVRTYNSLGQYAGDTDNWRMSAQRTVALAGTLNTAGSTVTLTGWDGSVRVFAYDTAYFTATGKHRYISTDGDGAYDVITKTPDALTAAQQAAVTTAGVTGYWVFVDSATQTMDAFEASGRVAKTFDLDGVHRLSYGYDANGFISYVQTAAIGETTYYDYTGNNLSQIRTVNSASQTLTRTRYTYDASNRLTQVTVDLSPEDNSIADGKIYTTTYTYVGATRRIASIAQTDGSLLAIAYDASDRVTQLTQTAAAGDTRITSFAYFADRTEITDPRHYGLPTPPKTILYKDAANQLTKIVSPPAQTGAAAQEVQFYYDAAGNLTRVVDAIGGETNYLYDANGNVRSISDPTGGVTERFYDANNRLIHETQLIVDYVRLGANALTSSSAGSPGAVSNLSSLWTVADGVAEATLPSVGDFAGLGPKDVVVAEVGRTYRLSVELKVDGAYQYESALGPPINLGARMLNSSYAELRHVVKSATAQDLGAGWVKLELEVTALGGEAYIRPFVYRRNSLTGAGTLEFRNLTIDSDQTAQSFHHTRYVYDGESHLRYAISAEGRVTEYRYLATGALQFTIEYPEHPYAIGPSVPTESAMNAWRDGLADRSTTKIAEYRYDARGNINETLQWGAASSTGGVIGTEGLRDSFFTYDQAGQLLQRNTSPHVAETFVYDGMGRMILSTDLAGGTTQVIFQDASTTTVVKTAVTYNAGSQAWDETASSYVTTSVYNKAGDLISTTDAGNALGGNYTNGGTQAYLYDKNGQVRMTTDATGYKSYFLYDKMGRKVADIGHDGQLVEYRYDEAGRLAATVRYTIKLTAEQLITLDNPLSEVELGPSGSAFPRPAAHIYDIWQWSVYDASGRITETIEGDGSVTRYEYDQADLLVKTTGFVNKLTSTQITGFMTAAPTAFVLPTAHANDRTTRTFYDRDGRLIGALNAEGHLSRCLYDSAGQKIQEIAYANATQESLRASGTFAQLLASITQDAGKDISTRYVYDGQGLLRFTIDALNRVTENIYWANNEWKANGLIRKSVAYATPLGSVANYKYATVKAAVAALASSSNDRATYFFYNDRAQLAYTVDATGAVTGLKYDIAGRVVKTTQYATRIADMTGVPLDHPWWMDDWATNNGTDARITRNYYGERGDLRFVVDAEGYVTRNDYDQEGRLFTQYRYGTQLTVDDSWTVDSVSTANKGAAVSKQFRYDRMGRLQDVYDGNGVRRFMGYYANGMQAWEIVALGQGTDENRIQYIYDQAGKKIVERRMTSETQNATSQGAFDTLLNQAERLVSPNGQYSALLTREGELRVYHKGELIWTNGVRETVAGATYRLVAQTDGNLVVHRDVNGQYSGSIWQSNTYGVYTGPTFVEMQNDGNLVYKKGTDPANQTGSLWSTATTGVVASDPNASEFVDTTFTYDGLGNLTSVKDAKNNATNFTHDKVGRVLTSTDALSGLTQFQYDAFGRGVKTIDARGNASYAHFDQAGRVKLAIDAENYATRTIYTAFSETGSVTRYYNRATDVGNLAVEPTVAIHTLDATTSFEYDKLGRVTKAIDAQTDAGGVQVYEQYTLNAFGQRISVRNRLGGVTNYAYDKRGLLLSETLPVNSVRADGTVQAANVVNKFEYDSRGNRTKMIEAFGLAEARTTTYAYDAADRLITTTGDTVNAVASATGAEASVAPTDQIFYDRHGNIIEKRDAANARTLFWYDKLNRVTHMLSPFGTLTRYFYDKNGNVTETRIYATPVALPADAKGLPPNGSGAYRTTLFSHDALNRLTQTQTPNITTAAFTTSLAVTTQNLVTAYEYDAMGNVVKTTDANGGQTWSYYDKLGRKITQIDAENYRTDWTYNDDGNVLSERRYSLRSAAPTSTTTPPAPPATNADDRVTEFTYDKMGRRLTEKRIGVLMHNGSGAHTTQDATITYAYNGLGEVTRKTEATGEFISYAYDSGGRMTSEQRSAFIAFDGQTSVTPTVEYSYNGLNDLSRTRQLGSTGAVAAAERVTTYAYGAGGRLLTRTDAEGFVRTYRYDAVGRTTREEYVRVMPTGTATEAVGYDYDIEGRVLQQGLVVYSAVAWTRSGAAIDTAMMHYNAFGEVSERGMNGVYAEKFDYDDAGRLWRTTAGDGTWKYFMYDKAGNQTLAIASDGTNIDNQTLAWVLDRWGADRAAIGTTYVDGVTATITRYDGRNQAIDVREPQRELSATLRQDLITSRGYTAFGEVKSETNALGHTIDYTYNTMGRRIKTESPQVSITLENGTTQNMRPTEHAYYDVSGRLVASRDANGNLTRLTLLAGTGYDGSQALTTAVTTADNAVVATGYDIHGDARKIADQLNRVTAQTFDRMGRLVQLNRPGGLIEYYRYDGLGQRIRHFNNLYNPSYNPSADPTGAAAISAELTTYDQQGRIAQHIAMGGDATTYAYAWSGAIATAGLGTFGGWTQTTTYANGKTLIEQTDMFARDVQKTDLGARVSNFTYDKAGRLVQRSTPSSLASLNYAYYNTGRLSQAHSYYQNFPSPPEPLSLIVDTRINTTKYGYDAVGNLISEVSDQYRDLELVIVGHWWTPPGAPEPQWFPDSDTHTITDPTTTATATYDALGRLKTWSQTASATIPGASVAYEYDANGNIRRSNASYHALDAFGAAATTASTQDFWYRYDALNRLVTDKGTLSAGVIVRGTAGADLSYDAAGQRATMTTNAASETYSYDDAGRVEQVNSAGVRRSTFGYDLMGRMTSQNDYESNGATVAFSRAVTYNAKGQITYEVDYTRRSSTIYETRATYDYGSGSSYALGSPLTISVGNYTNGAFQNTSLTTNGYAWYDGAMQANIVYQPNTSQSTTTNSWYTYANFGGIAELQEVFVNDGRQRTIRFTNDVMSGQALRRDETDNLSGGDPHEVWYRFGGKQIGYVGNNGTRDTDYQASIGLRTAAPGSGAFFNGSSTSVSYANFDVSIGRITSYDQGSTAGVYSVREGDTLASIAANLWGDASLWYKLAEANGLSDQSGLSEGQTLTIPAGVLRATNTSKTFDPYNPDAIIGDTAPTTPRQPKPRKNKCGVFGQILLVVIAVVVSIYTAGAASGAFASLFSSMGMGATAASVAGAAVGGAVAGAAGSITSQAVGVATGIQEKFSWNAVALAAIGSAVGVGGVGGAFGGKVVGAMINSAITQGIGVLTGLQDKFSWAGVAAAGVAAGVGHALGGDKLRPLYGENASRSLGNVAAHAGVASARAVASAATRSLIEGSDFGDNMLAALPDVIGQTIGESIAGAFAGGRRNEPEAMLHEASHASNDGDVLRVTPPVVFDEMALDLPPPTEMAELASLQPISFGQSGVSWTPPAGVIVTDFGTFVDGASLNGVGGAGALVAQAANTPSATATDTVQLVELPSLFNGEAILNPAAGASQLSQALGLAQPVYSPNGKLIALTGLHLTQAEYLQAVEGLWGQLQGDNEHPFAITSNAGVAAASAAVQAAPSISTVDVSTDQSLQSFLLAAAKPTAGADIGGGNQHFEKFLTFGTNAQGEIIVTTIAVVGSQGAVVNSLLPSGTRAMAHIHYNGLVQPPHGGDNSAVKFRNIPSIVFSSNGNRVWEVGRQGGSEVVRRIFNNGSLGSWTPYQAVLPPSQQD